MLPDQVLSTEGICSALEGQRAGNKRQSQETEHEGEGEGDKGLPLGREETDMTHRQEAACKGKGDSVRLRCLI